MNTNLHRLWAIVDTISGEVLYSACQYTLAKKHYDYLLQLHNTDKSKWHKLFGGDLGREFLKLYRYDLARHYIEPTFGNCFKAALVDSLPGAKSTSMLTHRMNFPKSAWNGKPIVSQPEPFPGCRPKGQSAPQLPAARDRG